MRAKAAAIAVAILGCGAPSTAPESTPGENAAQESSVAIFSWRTAGGEL